MLSLPRLFQQVLCTDWGRAEEYRQFKRTLMVRLWIHYTDIKETEQNGERLRHRSVFLWTVSCLLKGYGDSCYLDTNQTALLKEMKLWSGIQSACLCSYTRQEHFWEKIPRITSGIWYFL